MPPGNTRDLPARIEVTSRPLLNFEIIDRRVPFAGLERAQQTLFSLRDEPLVSDRDN